ncbi:hypothetical protein TBK1r_22410 [Stieleria magnilauensis]|uniref:Uncharacterized protein n=1 Tax=Stieleria magnilauensis TaxID=2527963 RepID=A0ABX5XTV4_9BACT|nr:hypothetical protein TBK1r_22410 [Planctomycetes bacterium TBK1r]
MQNEAGVEMLPGHHMPPHEIGGRRTHKYEWMFCISYLISRGRITGNEYSDVQFTLEPRTGQLNF